MAVTVSLPLLIGGCASSKVSSMALAAVKQSVRVIALTPGGGLMADAVGVELANRGFTIIDPSSTSNMMIRLNLNEVEVAKPEGLTKLREQGIDALLIVRTVGGYDQQPQSASARMNSTQSGQLLAGVTWQNGYGGMAGSPADRVMRKGLSEAAIEIADALAARVNLQK